MVALLRDRLDTAKWLHRIGVKLISAADGTSPLRCALMNVTNTIEALEWLVSLEQQLDEVDEVGDVTQSLEITLCRNTNHGSS